MILIAYATQQLKKLQADDLIYILLNLIGSMILAVVAYRVRQMGLTLMEGAWALISITALLRLVRRR
jgi:hypothetical protein